MTLHLLRAERSHARKGNSNQGDKTMTTKNETTKGKQAPAFYIFDTIEVDGKKEYKRVGAAFKHGKGNGYNVVINDKRYTAFPPKANDMKKSPDVARPAARRTPKGWLSALLR
jgi:hypothetical protein